MNALAYALRQELPDVSDDRADFAIDGLAYAFRMDEETGRMFAYAVLGELPADEAARDGLFGELLRSQFCFSETCGFTFGVDPETSFAILQALIDVRRMEESDFTSEMERFVQTANVWAKESKRRVTFPRKACRHRKGAEGAPRRTSSRHGNKKMAIDFSQFLTKLTDPRTALMADFDKAQKECFELPDGPQHDLAEQECERLREEMRRLEAEQTENMSDEQIVEMVEKAIHDHPKELPLLNKYYK